MTTIRSVLTRPQIARLIKIAETGDSTGPNKPLRRLEELKLVRRGPKDQHGIIRKYELTGTGRLAYRAICVSQ